MSGGRRLMMAGMAVAGACALSAGNASASMPMVKKAKELGITSVTSCQSCHVDKLPKKDAHKVNERGQWLLDQKAKKNAKEIDVAWLKDYVEKK
jgi:precorrin-2 methylase